MPRGQGKRCHGFLSNDGRVAHCSREEFANGATFNPDSSTYAHRLESSQADDFARCPWPYPCDYEDESGEPLVRVARWTKPDGTKTYSVYHPTSAGWAKGRGGARRVPYQLPELRAAVGRGETIYITEGEKCVETVRSLGLSATCNDGGAGKWRPEHTAGLRGATHVVILPDNDNPGLRHAEQVATALVAAGVPDVRIAALDVAEGEDVADLIGRHPTGQARAELLRIAEAAPRFEAKGVPAPAKRPAPQGRGLGFKDPEPWPEPVSGVEWLDQAAAVVRRFIVMPEAAVSAVALWALMTWAIETVPFAVRLLITSPTRSCGKSHLLAVLGGMVRRPLPASSITAAALFRVVESATPTLMLDEIDNARLRENDELRAIVNSGHSRGSAFVLRTVGDQHEPRRFSTWGAIALAGIGRVPDTIASRSVLVAMSRKPRGVQVERLREEQLQTELEPLRRKAVRWASDHGPHLANLEPALPTALDGRQADNWSVLVSIAEMAGGEWPERARAAALGLELTRVDVQDVGEQLLADIRAVFSESGVDRIASVDLTSALVAREFAPWGEWRQGRPLTERQLARLLRDYHVEPRTLRLADDRRLKGYSLELFEDAFSAYLPPVPPIDPCQRDNPHEQQRDAASPSVTPPACVTDENRAEATNGADCHAVTETERGLGEAPAVAGELFGLQPQLSKALRAHGWTLVESNDDPSEGAR